jgi:hypothetical protein
MRYTIRRIAPGTALRVGCALGWLVALCPALGLAWLAAQLIQRLSQALAQIEPLEIALLGQPIARIDLLEILRLSTVAQVLDRLAANLPMTFLMIAFVLMLLGAAALAVAVLLFSVGYNLLARLGGGLEVELLPGDTC